MAKDISNNANALYDLLKETQVIALVGHSDKPDRDSYQVAAYLRDQGYTVIPVNPTVDEIDGHTSYKSLRDVPGRVDLVDVFRGKRHVPGIVDDAIAVGAKAVWTQLGIIHDEAAQTAIDNGLDVVMNRCTKVEHARLQVGKRG
jgi:predicted CoA-binding protein